MVKVLFLIHDLGQGGAEKVLVNLVNHMDRRKFDISVTALFGGGVNERFLKPDIHYRAVFPTMIPANSYWMKAMSPEKLHDFCVKEKYDIEVAFLEGPSIRVISGCRDKSTKLIGWIHCTMQGARDLAASFRSSGEAELCYNKLNKLAFVSEGAKAGFLDCCTYAGDCVVLENVIDYDMIVEMAKEKVAPQEACSQETFKLIAVGTLKPVKGYDRLLRVFSRLIEDGHNCYLSILGIGPQQKDLERQIDELGLKGRVSLPGYQINPYKYVADCDLLVCSSWSEGYSTAVIEALILGTPVCTVDVSGMHELLGESDYGLITENSEEALYKGLKDLLSDGERLKYYKQKAIERGKSFETGTTVKAIEDMLLEAYTS